MSTMKAARWHNTKDIRVEETTIPQPGKGQVQIAVKFAGICGSDLHEYAHGPITLNINKPYPLNGHQGVTTLGHEFSGIVSAVGEGATKYKVGDRVVIEPIFRNFASDFTTKGQYNLGENFGFIGLNANGGFAKYTVVEEYMVHAIPDTLSFEQAALVEPAAVAVYAVLRSGLTIGQSVAIFGAGPIGLLCVQAAKAAGATEIIVSDVSADRLKIAAQVGATHVINGKAVKVAEEISAITRGGVDVALECADVQATFTTATKALRNGGTLVVVALFAKPAELNAFDIVVRELTVKGSMAYRNIFPEVIRLIDKKILDVEKLISSKIKLDNIVPEGFDILLNNPSKVKILVDLDQS